MKLAKVGFVSDVAYSGAEVISKATTRRYAAILIDLQLPDCDGISLIRELRAQPQNRDTPIVVVSSDVTRGREDLRSPGLHVLDWFQKPVDVDRLAELLQRPGPHDDSRRPHILHLDNDPEVLRIVAQAVASTADVTSVATLGAARDALVAGHFDLAVIDMELSTGTGLELLSEMRDRDGDAIPVIVFSGPATSPTCAAQIQEALDKSTGSIQGLVATLRKRIGRAGYATVNKTEVA
jgi:CheY-like chemotaxis protein